MPDATPWDFWNTDTPDVRMLINGDPWDLWTSLQITLSMEELAPQFVFDTFDVREDVEELFPFVEGDTVQISVRLPGQSVYEKILTGYLERPEISDGPGDGDSRITVTGGPKGLDLVQAHAEPKRWNDAIPIKIANDICSPFGIVCTSSEDISEAVKRFEIDAGETAGAALQRLAEMRGVLAMVTPEGNVEFVRATETPHSVALRAPGNIIRGTATGDFSDRFSQYTVFSQRTPQSRYSKALAAGMAVQIQDDQVRRFRPYYTVSDKDEDPAQLTARAQHLRNVRAGRSRVYGCEVDSWDDGLGGVWKPNTLLHVQHKRVGIDDPLIISRAILQASATEGFTTHLDLARRETFDLLQKPQGRGRGRRSSF